MISRVKKKKKIINRKCEILIMINRSENLPSIEDKKFVNIICRKVSGNVIN